MHLPEHTALWKKISEFSFDDPKAAITFSRKLAKQQKWTSAYTKRVIDEYRKFIFLCCISPNGASPSKAVDEAWHLHLTYTQSYWTAFCKNTLGKEIHHHPSSGGTQENHKHEQWYAETLALYEQVFGMRAPSNIWPAPAVNQSAIRLSTWRIQKTVLLGLVVLLSMPFAISYIAYDEWFPFELRGPQFLWFYIWLSGAALLGFYMIRRERDFHLRRVVDEYFPGNMNVYQLSHLVYGKHRAIQTAVIDLYHRDLLSVNVSGSITVHNKRYKAPPNEENPLVPGFLAERDGDLFNYEMIAANWYTENPYDHSIVAQLNRYTYGKGSWFKKYLIIIVVVLIGAARVFQGVYNDRPVGYLVLEILALTVIAFYLDKRLTHNNALLQKAQQQLWQKNTDGSLTSDFAINGHSALTGIAAGILLGSVFSSYAMPPLTYYADRDTPSPPGSWNSCTGASSCSGGDSSCGGGGCGGCGGGGGGD